MCSTAKTLVHTSRMGEQLAEVHCLDVGTTHTLTICLVIIVCRFWCIKWLVVLGLVVAFFFIPDGSNYAFSQGFCHPLPTPLSPSPSPPLPLPLPPPTHTHTHSHISPSLPPTASTFSPSTAILGIGLTGSFIFILVQVILLVDFAHTWAETW